MKVILLQNIPGTGERGEVKNVADGFAQNFLFKKGLARVATKEAITKLESQVKKKVKQAEVDLKDQQKVASKIDGSEIEISSKVSEAGTLYAAITTNRIVQEIKNQLGAQIKSKQIKLKIPIKEMGEYGVKISFDHGLEAELRVVVSPE